MLGFDGLMLRRGWMGSGRKVVVVFWVSCDSRGLDRGESGKAVWQVCRRKTKILGKRRKKT